MNYKLKIELVADSTSELAVIESPEMVIGREPVSGITLSVGAVSREHGKFLKVRHHWLYSDLNSTNGSWINGNQVVPDKWYILRNNDYIQLADQVVRIKEIDVNTNSPVEISVRPKIEDSLLLFTNKKFADEFPIPKFGKALVIGGVKADVVLSESLYENPSLVVERRAGGVCAYRVESQSRTTLNGEPLLQTVELNDRDTLVVDEHLVIFSAPPARVSGQGVEKLGGEGARLDSWGSDDEGPPPLQPMKSAIEKVEDKSLNVDPQSSSFASPVGGEDSYQSTSSQIFDSTDGGFSTDSRGFSSYREKKKPSLSAQFGQVSDEGYGGDETVALDSEIVKNSQLDLHRGSGRYSYDVTDDYSFTSTEDKITIFVAIFLFFLLIALIIWWVFLV